MDDGQLELSVAPENKISLGEADQNVPEGLIHYGHMGFPEDQDGDVEDYGELEGISGADEILFQRANELYFVEQERLSKVKGIERSLNYLEMINKIARRKSPGLKGMRGIFIDLRGKDYDIKPYSRMNKEDSLEYLREVRSDVARKLEGLHYKRNFWTRGLDENDFS